MTSSAEEVSYNNLNTASAVRTETVTGSHKFKVFDYSLTKGIGIGRAIKSDVFTIGGYDWVIKYYPDGNSDTDNDENISFISFYLCLETESEAVDVRARYTLTLLQQNGAPSSNSRSSLAVRTFNILTHCWGYHKFIKRSEFEASECLKDDAFTVKCTVTVLKATKLEVSNPCGGVIVPPSNLTRNLADLLESGKGADVTFVVNGERFKAHRGVLATRSAVFNAMFFGGIKEKWTDTIEIDDIEAPVFKSMLYFIYTDSVPDIDGTGNQKNLFNFLVRFINFDLRTKQERRLMAEHLIVAADRYGLERLRFICEDVLCKNLSVSNAATTLMMAERYNCRQLKAQCLKFMSSAEVFIEVSLTPDFQNLLKICPSVTKDIKALKFKC